MYHFGLLKECEAWKGIVDWETVKKTKISVQYGHMKSCNSKVKDARAKHFWELTTSNQHNLRILFNTSDQLLNPGSSGVLIYSSADNKILPL